MLRLNCEVVLVEHLGVDFKGYAWHRYHRPVIYRLTEIKLLRRDHITIRFDFNKSILQHVYEVLQAK